MVFKAIRLTETIKEVYAGKEVQRVNSEPSQHFAIREMKRSQQNDVKVARKIGGKPGEHDVLEPRGKDDYKEKEWLALSNVADRPSKSKAK